MVLSEKDKEAVKKLLEPVKEEVKLLFFRSDTPTCQYCDVIKELLDDIHEANPNVVYEEIRVEENPEKAKKYGIEQGPVILFEKVPRIIYMGIPSGHEFRPFLDDIILVGTGKLPFEPNPHLLEHLNAIDALIDVYVFVTPSCPYCPYAVKAAHLMAYLNENIRGFMIEAIEYSDLADKYRVSGVPKNVIIDRETGETLLEWEGCPPMIDAAFDMFVHETFHAYLHKKGVEHHHEH